MVRTELPSPTTLRALACPGVDTDALDHFPRERSPVDTVARDHDVIHRNLPQVLDDRFERRHVAVNVGQDSQRGHITFRRRI